MARRRVAAALCTAIVLLMGAASVSAQVAGHKVTVTNADPATGDVDIYVTGYMDNTYPFTTLWIGFYTFFGGAAPAIDWGDGSTVPPFGNGPSTGIPRVATSTSISGFNVHVYRGSFSHTYAAPGSYTITSNSVPRPINHTPITGNYALTPTYFGTYAYLFLSNTAVADLSFDAINIPTTSEVGLLALALALGTAGALFLRRS